MGEAHRACFSINGTEVESQGFAEEVAIEFSVIALMEELITQALL